MKKVITYGTFDLLHYGHIRLLERAKALGDFLIVGITAETFDRARGKINVQQSLIERIEAVKALGIANEIIVEEYEGQKIDDVKRFDIDTFVVGSDWTGQFDYLKEYCEVVYLERTEGVSSSELRTEKQKLRLALIGEQQDFLEKIKRESYYVNGIEIVGIFNSNNFEQILPKVDAVYLYSHPKEHYTQIRRALENGKHVLCESPMTISLADWQELIALAKQNDLVLMDAIRTAYALAYNRLLLLAQSGKIGKIVSVDVTCTSIRDRNVEKDELINVWNSICSWGPNALLPVFQLLGTNYSGKQIVSHLRDEKSMYDTFTKIDFVYPEAVASIKVGKEVKSEGELIISGTDGYIYVPAPWWKTEYFEIRREDLTQNQRYFYQLDGEGIRYELVSFIKAIQTSKNYQNISANISKAMVQIMEDFYNKKIVQI